VAYALTPAPVAREGPKWEYRVVSHLELEPAPVPGANNVPVRQPLANDQLAGQLTKLGEEGWELTAVVGPNTRNSIYYLKRRK
jgi:hypothetical protein